MPAPLCRYCGTPIAKDTNWKYLVTDPEAMKYSPDRKVLVEKLPQNRSEAQKLFNRTVVSVKRHKIVDSINDTVTDMGIDQVGLWDGESYVDRFFCNGEHAKKFGYLLAKEGRCTNSYNKAREAQTRAASDTPHGIGPECVKKMGG